MFQQRPGTCHWQSLVTHNAVHQECLNVSDSGLLIRSICNTIQHFPNKFLLLQILLRKICIIKLKHFIKNNEMFQNSATALRTL